VEGYRVEIPPTPEDAIAIAIKDGEIWEGRGYNLYQAVAELYNNLLPTPQPPNTPTFPRALASPGWQFEFQRYQGLLYRGYAIAKFPDGRWWSWNGLTVGTAQSKEDTKRSIDIERSNKQAFRKFTKGRRR
jgi:hypothetical protein